MAWNSQVLTPRVSRFLCLAHSIVR